MGSKRSADLAARRTARSWTNLPSTPKPSWRCAGDDWGRTRRCRLSSSQTALPGTLVSPSSTFEVQTPSLNCSMKMNRWLKLWPSISGTQTRSRNSYPSTSNQPLLLLQQKKTHKKPKMSCKNGLIFYKSHFQLITFSKTEFLQLV